MKIDYAARARALVGTRFRVQGRGDDGLDCIGVILATFEIPPASVRHDYSLRGDHLHEIREALEDHFRRVPRSHVRTGDVMLLQAGERQFHLAVKTAQGFVHAHANIRRVVETPGEPNWPLLGAYRKRRSR
ncbi:MAG: peptidoglycan endopeptidase [Sphingomonas sp.]|nr:peptidoglycan endopeptidase [Sphingomonas sp.]